MIKVEDGSVVIGANSYVSSAFVTTYLTERNRVTENGWQASPNKDAACIAGTSYIEQRWADRLKGRILYPVIQQARATATFTGNPVADQTFTVAGVVYTFRVAVAAATDVLIGENLYATANNLAEVLTSEDDGVTASSLDGVVTIVAHGIGAAGNLITLTTTAPVTLSSATLLGGSTTGRPQPLQFPRSGLYDRTGNLVVGMPYNLLAATAEYAVRSLAAALLPDPTLDARGRAVTGVREKVGPIETETTYADGSALANLLRPYPAADRLLIDFVNPSGGVVR